MKRPPTFLQFCDSIGLTLTPGQRVFAAIAFDRASIDALPEDDQGLARKIFGGDFPSVVPAIAYSTIVPVLGRAVGKTTLGGVYLFWRGLVADLRRLAPGELAFALCVAPDVDTARQTLTAARSVVERRPALASCIESDTTDTLMLRRPDGRCVSIEVFAASAGGKSIRGRSIVGAVFDESAFFRDASASVNDVQLYQAAIPRLLEGGAILLPTTPWLRSGLTWGLFDSDFGKPKVAVVAHASTSLMRTDDPDLLARVDAARERDPINAAREFDAEWLPIGAGNLFDPVALQDSHVDHVDRHGHGEISIGGDFGLTSDPTAFVVSQKCWTTAGFTDSINVLEVVQLKPARGKPIELERVVRTAAELCSTYGTRKVRVDNWSLAQAREWASKLNLKIVFEAASEGDDRQLRFQRAADAFKAGRVKIPRAYPELTEQLSSLVATPRVGGGYSYSAPRRSGSHADAAMAALLSFEPLFTPAAWEAWRKLPGNEQRAANRMAVLAGSRPFVPSAFGPRACRNCRRYSLTGSCCDNPR